MDDPEFKQDDFCSEGITPIQRAAYAQYRKGKGLPETLRELCCGDIKQLDRFFTEHMEGCIYCREGIEEALSFREVSDGDSEIESITRKHVILERLSDIDIIGAARETRIARQEFNLVHIGLGYEDQLRDYITAKAKGEGGAISRFDKHMEGCESCKAYYVNLIKLNQAGKQ